MKTQKTTINLRTWMFLKITPAVLFWVYYWMCTRDSWSPAYMYIQTAIFAAAGLLVGYQISYAKRKDIFDEFAKENLKTTDSICLKIAYTLMIIAAVACIFSDFSGEIAGYCILTSILLLTILRAVIFSIIDKKGM
ncbi:hypothetical protein [Lachnoclostridium sp. An181]|uniref:hypothetical protein n=1 Tax=Lachnoclostridium sp. An181 TaxID=1965575 RepID=UPI000B37035D|nr:hypothetical protein [Lachnoclostridium sp. An181]OUP49265.1 hypothetical protein B5F18_08475 [Lachnoclostridium sp. An181]